MRNTLETMVRRRRGLTPALALTLATAAAGCAAGDGPDEFGAHAQPLLNASASGDHPVNNAVAISQNAQTDGCTVTLVAPDIVLSARRCFPRNGLTDAQRDGRWYQVPRPENQPVWFGPRRMLEGASIANFMAWPRFMSHVPVVNGHDEELMLAAFDVLVPREVAVPRAVQWEAPATQPFNVVVYGYETLTPAWERRFASGTAGHVSVPDMTNGLWVSLANGAQAWANRDYGAAVFLGSTSGPLVGVVTRLNESSVTGIRTYGTGTGVSPPGPSVWGWLRGNVQRSFCSSHGYARDTTGTLRGLYQWWSSAATDHRLSSEDGWKGCDAAFDTAYTATAAYRYQSLEGWVSETAVAGTSALYLWHNATTGDWATSTGTPGSGYTRGALMGYVWSSSAADRVALQRYFSSSRGDLVASTRHPGGDYVLTGTIGYVRRADTAAASTGWRGMF